MGYRVTHVLAASLAIGVALQAQRQRMDRCEPPEPRSTLLGHAPLGSAPAARRTNIDVSRAPGPQNEVSIAIPRDDPLSLVVASHDYRTGRKHIGTWASIDGGRTWKGEIGRASCRES